MGWPTHRKIPKPFPNDACLPKYHYLHYDETPKEDREPDDWQPRAQLKKKSEDGTLLLSDAESVAAFSDKFIVKVSLEVDYLRHLEVIQVKKKKRTEERAKESREAKERSYEDYDWADLCENAAQMKKLRVPELNKYLKQHSRHHHLENNKNEKIEVIQRHWHLQKEAESTDPLRLRVRDAAHETFKEDQEDEANDDCDSINSVDSEDENKNDVLASGPGAHMTTQAIFNYPCRHWG